MKPEMIALAKALGLDPEKSSEEEILAAAQKNHESFVALQEDVASIKQIFKLDDDASIDKIQEAVKAAVEETASKEKPGVNPEEYVPREMYEELATRMDSIEKDTASKAASEAVASAIKAGKIAPAQKEWAEDYASTNLDGFNKFVEKQPVIVSGETAAARQHADGHGGLTEQDIEVAKQLGVDPETLKDKKEEKAA